MSSLAGALDDYSISRPRSQLKQENDAEYYEDSQDVDMHTADRTALTNSMKHHPDEEMTDLFGNDQDVEESKDRQSVLSPSASAHDSEAEQREALEYGEEEIPPEVAVEVKEAHVSFPNIPVPKGSDGDCWVIRMPNFVNVDTKPFHPDTYIGPEQEDEDGQQPETLREKSMTIKLKVENTVRWRWVKNNLGQDQRQSNGRIIRWSDGSLSLRLGKELFDINQTLDNAANAPRSLIGSQSTQSLSQPDGQGAKQQGLTYLVAQHKRSQVLQAEAVIKGYMSLRPTGMQSETHRMLVRAVGQKHNKVARLRMAPDPLMDPEREKMELLKQSAKKTRKRPDYDDGLGGSRKRRYTRKTATRDLWSDDEDEDGAALSGGYDEDDEISGSARRGGRRGHRDKRGAEEYQEDDFVVADSSDEDTKTQGRRATHAKDDVEEDPLDRLDAKIEEQDAKLRREWPKDDGVEGAGEEMDIESEEEEEEEEYKVRKPGGTRRRAAVFDDDDEE